MTEDTRLWQRARRAASGIRLERGLSHLVAGSSISVLGLILPGAWTVGLLAALCGVALTVEALRLSWAPLNALVFRWFGALFKAGERTSLTGATYMVLSALAAFLLFRNEVAVLSLLFLAVGDPVAALVGSRTMGPRLFGKSFRGAAAFVATALALSAIMAGGTALDFGWALITGAGVAAAAEMLPGPVDDNLKIPLLSGAAMTLLL